MKNKALIIIIAAIAVIAAAAVAVILVLNPFGGDDDGGSSSKRSDGEIDISELYSFSPGEYFVTNVKDSNKLVKVSMALMLDDEKMVETLKNYQYVIRDTVIYALRQQDEEALKSETIQEELRLRLTQDLNDTLGIDNIVTVYFSDFVMQ